MKAAGNSNSNEVFKISNVFRIVFPLIMGYIPVGLAFGVLARDYGVSVGAVALMSFFVYAGSAQFVMIAQMASGINPVVIALTAGVVNLRCLLMSTAFAAKLAQFSVIEKLLFALHLIDQQFVVQAERFEQLEREAPEECVRKAAEGTFRKETHAINFSLHITWVLSTTAGALFGAFLGDIEQFGIDFALTGVFISLLAPRLHDSRQRIVALVSGIISTILLLAGVGQWNITLAMLCAATVGVKLCPARS